MIFHVLKNLKKKVKRMIRTLGYSFNINTVEDKFLTFLIANYFSLHIQILGIVEIEILINYFNICKAADSDERYKKYIV